MFWVLFLVCAARTVFGIIVRESEPLGEEYTYSYEFEDPTTGESKSLQEARLGLVVAGRYCVLEPDDGIVTYTADPYAGFKAILVQEPAFPHSKLQEYTSFEDQLPQLGNPYFKLQTNRHSKPRNKYFTPANEILSKKSPINGLYFEPNRNEKLNMDPFM